MLLLCLRYSMHCIRYSSSDDLHNRFDCKKKKLIQLQCSFVVSFLTLILKFYLYWKYLLKLLNEFHRKKVRLIIFATNLIRLRERKKCVISKLLQFQSVFMRGKKTHTHTKNVQFFTVIAGAIAAVLAMK